MKTLFLHGALAAKYGDSFRMDVETPSDALRLMQCNFPDFRTTITGCYYKFSVESGPIYEDQLFMSFSGDELHMDPILGGSFKGLFGLFLGLPLVSSVFAPLGLGGGLFAGGGGAAGLFGGAAAGGLFGGGSFLLAVTLLGITVLLASALNDDEEEKGDPDERASFLFNGAVNVNEQGGPVPLVYGRVRTGSVVIHGGLEIERL